MLNPVSSHPPENRSGSPSGPPATDPPMPLIPRLDLNRPPADGALAWLLAYGLPSAVLRRANVQADPERHDPGLQQAWRHAQNFYRATGGEGQQDEPFASPSGAASDLVLREPENEARQVIHEALSEEFAASFARAMGVQQPDPDRRPESVRADMKKIMATAWLLDLPVDPRLASLTPDKRSEARSWKTTEVYGLGSDAVRVALGEACTQTLAQLDADGLPDTEPLKPDYQRAAADLRDFTRECITRLQFMKAG